MLAVLSIALAAALVAIARLALVCRTSMSEQRHTDPLTGLPNRLGFEAIVAEHLKSALPFSIVWLDLDGFRRLNELRGHSNGDVLLAQVGPRIRRCLRPGDTVARFGGDQFLVLLRGHSASAGIAARMLSLTHASAGISLFPDHADNAPELLQLAEKAMRQAKINARGRAVFFDASLAATGFRGAEIASLIQGALANDRFRLMYQPIVDADGAIVRMEALVRIDDPVLGRVAPLEFIGVAEQTGLIYEVGTWILRQACAQAAEWRAAGHDTQVTINLSPLQVASGSLATSILSEIALWGLGTSAIVVHITGEIQFTRPVEILRSAGLHVSSQEPVFDEIRVAEPFNAPADQPDLMVVARGIETPGQLDRAHTAGCHLFQGFQIAPPLEPNDATEILRAGLFAGVGGLVSR